MTTTDHALGDDDAALAPDAQPLDPVEGGRRRSAWAVARSPWSYAIVMAWAAACRLLSAANDHVSAYYYPDSWSYVVKSRSLATLHPFHSPVVWGVWNRLIPGGPTERTVMMLHFGFGVAGVAILYHLLRRWNTSVWMLALALLYGCVPLMVLVDRSVLSESATVFFWLLMTLGLVNAISARHVALRLANAAGAGLAAGVSYAIRPATRYMVLTTLVLALCALLLAAWRRHGRWSLRIAEAVGAMVLIVVLMLPVPLRVMSDNQVVYGVSTLTPGAGTVLAARWSELIDCGPFDGVLQATRDALIEICQVPGDIRRDHSDLIWKPGPFAETLRPGPQFGRIQAELSAATRTAVLHHPVLAAENVLDRLRQFYFDQYDDLFAYHNGSVWVDSPDVRAHFRDFDHWFGGIESRAPLSGRTFLERAVVRTMILPAILTAALLTLLGVLAWRVVRGSGRRRRLRALLAHAGTPAMVIVTGTYLVGVGSVGAGGVADFRYWAPILPALVLSVGGALALRNVPLDDAAPETPDVDVSTLYPVNDDPVNDDPVNGDRVIGDPVIGDPVIGESANIESVNVDPATGD